MYILITMCYKKYAHFYNTLTYYVGCKLVIDNLSSIVIYTSLHDNGLNMTCLKYSITTLFLKKMMV